MRPFDDVDLDIIRTLVECGLSQEEAEREVMALREPGFPMDGPRFISRDGTR